MRAKKIIEEKGIIETMVKKFNGKPTVHYKILENKLIEALVSYRDYGKYHIGTNVSAESGLSLVSAESGLSITESTIDLEQRGTPTQKEPQSRVNGLDDNFTKIEEFNTTIQGKEIEEFDPIQYVYSTLGKAGQRIKERWMMTYHIDDLDLDEQMEQFSRYYFAKLSEEYGEEIATAQIERLKLRSLSARFENSFLRYYKKQA